MGGCLRQFLLYLLDGLCPENSLLMLGRSKSDLYVWVTERRGRERGGRGEGEGQGEGRKGGVIREEGGDRCVHYSHTV